MLHAFMHPSMLLYIWIPGLFLHWNSLLLPNPVCQIYVLEGFQVKWSPATCPSSRLAHFKKRLIKKFDYTIKKMEIVVGDCSWRAYEVA